MSFEVDGFAVGWVELRAPMEFPDQWLWDGPPSGVEATGTSESVRGFALIDPDGDAELTVHLGASRLRESSMMVASDSSDRSSFEGPRHNHLPAGIYRLVAFSTDGPSRFTVRFSGQPDGVTSLPLTTTQGEVRWWEHTFDGPSVGALGIQGASTNTFEGGTTVPPRQEPRRGGFVGCTPAVVQLAGHKLWVCGVEPSQALTPPEPGL